METTVESGILETGSPTENPHVLWRQLVGLVLWVGIVGYFAYGVIGALQALALGGATFIDAWRSGIYKDPARRSFLNISPMSWGIAVPLLFIVAFPAYLINRNRLKTKQSGNGYFVATIVLGCALIALWILGVIAISTGAVA